MKSIYRSFLPNFKLTREDHMSDAEYRSRASLELCLPENRAAAMELLAADTRSRCFRVSVEGYDTSLPVDEIKDALMKHFFMACGGIVDVVVPTDPVTKLADRCAFMYLESEIKKQRALGFDGCDMGTWVAIVKPAPGPRECPISPEQAKLLRAVYYHKECSTPIWVEGYNIHLPEDQVRNALIKHFSSCGVIADLSLLRDPLTNTLTRMAFLYFFGQGRLEKALALNGTDAGGGLWLLSLCPAWKQKNQTLENHVCDARPLSLS